MRFPIIAFAVLASFDLGWTHFHEEQTLGSEASQFFNLRQGMAAPTLSNQFVMFKCPGMRSILLSLLVFVI